MNKIDPAERFMKNFVIDNNECWIWTLSLFPNGYSKFKVNGKSVKGHRFSYEYFVGKIPDGFVIDHLCRVKNCVNPKHLEAVTTRENIRRGIGFAAINAKKTTCPYGHEYSGLNKVGSRICKICTAAATKRCKAKKKANKV